MELSYKDLNRLRQWFNSLEDVNPKYLEPEDHALDERLLDEIDKHHDAMNQTNAAKSA